MTVRDYVPSMRIIVPELSLLDVLPFGKSVLLLVQLSHSPFTLPVSIDDVHSTRVRLPSHPKVMAFGIFVKLFCWTLRVIDACHPVRVSFAY